MGFSKGQVYFVFRNSRLLCLLSCFKLCNKVTEASSSAKWPRLTVTASCNPRDTKAADKIKCQRRKFTRHGHVIPSDKSPETGFTASRALKRSGSATELHTSKCLCCYESAFCCSLLLSSCQPM